WDGTPTSDDTDSYDPDADDRSGGAVDTDGDPESPARRRWLAGRADTADDASLKPATMRGTEPLYGYVVAIELIGVSILNLTVTHGTGAPAHPPTRLSVIGLIGSIALIGVI